MNVLAPQSEAIVVYTGWERHALIGSDIRLSCSFFSWRWTSEDVTFSWSYRPDGAKDSISVRTHIHACAHLTFSLCYWCKCFVNQKDFFFLWHESTLEAIFTLSISAIYYTMFNMIWNLNYVCIVENYYIRFFIFQFVFVLCPPFP